MSIYAPSARRRRIASAVEWLLMAPLAVAALTRTGPWVAVGLLGLAGAVLVNVVWWRCQHCHRWLGRASGRGYCQHCGRPLR